ncbi:MAG: AP2 domain-containing protein [Desulfomonile tiedjei]|nr:AP2 domain-containing protein [Desulfomonile tiedjei]
MPASTENPPRNITRVDNDASGDHVWVVVVTRKGESIVKRFSDGTYGGKRKALEAAVEYRDALLAQDEPFDHQIWIRTRLRKNNKSGIPGVHRYEIRDNSGNGNVREYWIATWTNEHGVTRQRKFSIARYGEEEAKLLAIAERDYQLRRVVAINVAAREAEPPDQEKVWQASRVEEGRDGEGGGKVRTGSGDHQRGRQERIRVVEAIIDEHGIVTLFEPVELTSTRRALVTILAEGREHPRDER